MKKTLLTALALFCFIAGAMSQINTPQPSPAGSVYSKVGLTDVTIDYFRPKVKGRKIFGEGKDYLQPYGETWRTGANSGSKLTLSTDAVIADTKVPAGEYLIFTVPGKDSWNFMLYSDLSIGGNVSAYDKKNEVLNISVKPTSLSQTVETLTFNIADISEDNTSANIQLSWDDVSIKVPVKVEFDEVVMKDIAANTKVNPSNYIAAANYYYNTDKDLNQALEWVNMYLAEGENSKQFWNVHLKAQILAKLGKKKEAIETAKKSMEAAKAFPQGDFGYIKRNEDLIASLK
ncbi:DUF2911 domain-containing protein [Fulvivirga sp. 29W222]|uniref:DUF2911 domain-containing protein n=1 Tax=Fulvivirga marina TaxID=2494733 RepID=A0A937G2N9_9BACT|nr:DUF2911 domain-containing protein [Fulvivirga marina]MBL6448928.1 DUF2911 domain-containing protein [Fulvivirga marina]